MKSVHLKLLSSIFHLNFLCNILFDAIDRYYICKEKTQMRRLLSWILLKYLRHVNIYMINWNVCYLDVSFCQLYLLYYQLWFWWCRIMVKESQWHILGDWDTFLRFWRLTRCILFECSFLFLQCIVNLNLCFTFFVCCSRYIYDPIVWLMLKTYRGNYCTWWNYQRCGFVLL